MTTLGAIAVAGGIALMKTYECTPEHCDRLQDQMIYGLILASLAAPAVVVGRVIWVSAPPAAAEPPRVPIDPAAPLLVERGRRDTEPSRAALQASLAARRGDCVATVVAMKRLANTDAALWERLRAHDAPIAACLLGGSESIVIHHTFQSPGTGPNRS